MEHGLDARHAQYFAKDPIHRKYEHDQLSFGMLYQYSENFTQVFSHDEVVHGKGSMLFKMPMEPISNKAHQLRLLYALMWLWPGKKTLFMGGDFGQSNEGATTRASTGICSITSIIRASNALSGI